MACSKCQKKKASRISQLVQEKVDEFVAPNELFSERMNQCEKCSYFSRTTMIPRCLHCGCFLDAKAKLKDSVCPIGKW